MGKKDKNKKKNKGAEKTTMKTNKNLAAKQKKLLSKIGEANIEEIVAKLQADESSLTKVTEILCPPPSPRSSFTLCTHPEKDELILFGGEFFNGQKIFIYNDLHFYNIAKKEWKLVKSPSGPTPRSGHQMVSIASNGGQLWLFGGEHASPSQLQFYHYKDLWVFQLENKKWEKINAPNGPSPRSGHRMVAAKKKIVIFGGFHDNNQSYQYFNDVHIFSLESYSWLNIEVGGAILPLPRSACCIAACSDGRILIWGGYTKSQIKKDIDRGITHTDMFALVPDKAEPATKFKWTSLKPGGIRPKPRSSVSYAAAPNGKVYCFGGVMDIEEDEENIKGQFGNDLYSLDLTTMNWRLIELNKKEKNKASKCDEVMTEDLSSVTTDGIFTVTVAGSSSIKQNTISSLFDQLNRKTGPFARMNTGLAVCKGILYMYGGVYEEDNRQNTLSDFYSLDLHKLDEWKTILPNNSDAHEWIDSPASSEGSDSSGSENDDDDTESNDSCSAMDTE